MVEVISEKKNPLFDRVELNLEVVQDVVPSHAEAKKIVADHAKADEGLVRIIKIESHFGSRNFNIIADVYGSKEEFDRVVKKTKQEIEAEKKAEEERLKAEAEAKAAAEAEKASEASEEGAGEDAGAEEKAEEASE